MKARTFGAWMDEGPNEVPEKALRLQKEKGWDAARTALGLTVR